MSQNDFVIDNGTGLAVRQDIESAFQALASNNSGSSTPSTTYAYQFWADTSAGTLKIRNSANNAWIELLQLDGTLTLEDGAVGTPALAFRDDLDTGVYSPSDNIFAIATAGVQRLQLSSAGTIFNEDGADVDFRIEGDSEANLFYLDAGNNRIGIGTSTPQSTVNIFGILEFNSFDSSSGSGGRFTSKGCLFGDAHSAGKTVSDDRNMIIWNERGLDIDFGTNDELIMKLNSAGNVGIGAASIADDSDHHKLAIAGDSGTAAGILIFQDTSNNEDGMIFADDGSLVLTADRANATANSSMQFRVDGSSERMRLFGTNEGLGIGSGIVDTSFSDMRTKSGTGNEGCRIKNDGGMIVGTSNNTCYRANRRSTDGELFEFLQNGSAEGNISVSGTTVSLNGGHLSRWSQLKGISSTDKSARPTIYQGTVMSNLDDLCVWTHAEIVYEEDVLYTFVDKDQETIPEDKSVGDVKIAKGTVKREAYTEENQQLNMTKVSDTEGDKDVAGVFWMWDDDDDEIVNDFYVAMTGDMVIRVAGSTTVARGDLMISAGDGTAKPQTDDIIRSSTIAKIISTNATATYADGSKAYPCVLMAC